MGDDRDPARPARGAGHRRPAAAAHARRDPRRGRAAACRPGEIGRIFVGHEMLFEGYTDGSARAASMVDGMMTAGDLGHLDERGPPVRRRARGRHDHLGRRERLSGRGRGGAARRTRTSTRSVVVGVDDERFGQRLVAFVVPRARQRPDGRGRDRVRRARTSRGSRSRARSRCATSCPATRSARCCGENCAPTRVEPELTGGRGGEGLADKAALITGGSSGIGLAVARALGAGRLRRHDLGPAAGQARAGGRGAARRRASTCSTSRPT